MSFVGLGNDIGDVCASCDAVDWGAPVGSFVGVGATVDAQSPSGAGDTSAVCLSSVFSSSFLPSNSVIA